VLATTPNFAWLMGVAYVDLASVACSVLAVYLFCRWLQERGAEGIPSAGEGMQGRENAYLWLSALMVGASVGTKMQGLALMGVLVVGVLLSRARKPDLHCCFGPRASDTGHRTNGDGERLRNRDRKPDQGTVRVAATGGLWQRLRLAAAYAVIALVVCWPWYLKSYLWTGNPVYPFAYNVFGGKLWSADRAEGYQRDQLEFGVGELPPKEELERMPALQRIFCGPRSPLNLLLAPVNITVFPKEFTVPLTTFGVYAMASIGPLYLALLPLLLIHKRPRAVRWLFLIFAPLWVWWLMSMQLTRYLLPSLALICPVVGWVMAEAEREGGLLYPVTKGAAVLWAAVALALIALYVIPQVPVTLGLQSKVVFLTQSLDVYYPSAYINHSTPENAKIALYGEPRGYYLDRDYLWADPGHSALIRYETTETPRDLVREYRRLGIAHLVVNMAQFPDLWKSRDRLALLMGSAIDEGLLEPTASVGPGGRYLIMRVRVEGDG